MSSTDCSVEWADLFVFVSWTERLPDLWPRVFWECAGHDRNLDSGGTKVAFVSLDSSGPVICLHVCLSSFHSSARAATPTIPSLVTCFIAMRLGPVDFISACVFCIMGRSESHVIGRKRVDQYLHTDASKTPSALECYYVILFVLWTPATNGLFMDS